MWWCFIFLWSFMKISWMVFRLQSGYKKDHRQFEKGNNFKNVLTRALVLLELFSSYRADTILWQTDGRTTKAKHKAKPRHNLFFCKNIYVSPLFGVILYCTFSEHLYYELPRKITQKGVKQQLWFLRCAHPLMLIYTHRKFCEDILNNFQVIEWIHFLWRTKF